MPTQKPPNGLLHKFKDVSQIGAVAQFLAEILRSFVVQTPNTPKVQYLTGSGLLNFANK